LQEDDIPRLYNYEGNWFAINDIIGDLEKDKDGSLKLDKGVDMKKWKVNKMGYLVDDEGNVINKDGKKIFDVKHLNENGEIPKILPFTKFNIYEVCGDLERNVDGKPVMNYNNKKEMVDQRGWRVN